MATPNHKLHPIPQVAIITGASEGIGRATALLAAQRGYAVCVNYLRRREEAEAIVAEITMAGSPAIAVQADVGVESDVIRLFVTAEQQLGGITALVNNAATIEAQTRLEAIDAGRLQRLFATNVFGSFFCAREAVRSMSTRHGGKGGVIVNVSSGAATWGSPGEYIDYAATKGAIDTMTVGLAREVAEEGIRVNAVRPGIIQTGLHAKAGEPNRVERWKANVPMQRGGDPGEVAGAILWLMSPEASYVTGAILNVTGGR
jgi:NAD(P)-dependent dehydrogenase (short-subunit alcohol dehydrogenase family)